MSSSSDRQNDSFFEEAVDSTAHQLLDAAATTNWEVSTRAADTNLSPEAERLFIEAVNRLVEWKWIRPWDADVYVVTEAGKAVQFEREAMELATPLLTIASESGWKLRQTSCEDWVSQQHDLPSSVIKRAFAILEEQGLLVHLDDDYYEVTARGKQEQRERYGL